MGKRAQRHVPMLKSTGCRSRRPLPILALPCGSSVTWGMRLFALCLSFLIKD